MITIFPRSSVEMKGERLGGKPSYLLEGCFKSLLVCLGKEDCISLIKLTLSAGLEKKLHNAPVKVSLASVKRNSILTRQNLPDWRVCV